MLTLQILGDEATYEVVNIDFAQWAFSDPKAKTKVLNVAISTERSQLAVRLLLRKIPTAPTEK